ncbi:MAG: hypothetical protein AMJ54_13725 [Deltaproteobacteria bacterium SG8_13]|nr:MAG: hypothetical protein AMJ54_13725 [Deltaproteobacteria bacterium SG8_13]
MPWEIKEIENYSVSVGSHTRPNIKLWGDFQQFGSVSFTEVQPRRPRIATGGIYYVELPLSRFDSVLSILRNERPVRLMYLADPAQQNQGIVAYITTLKEPTGEEESSIE